MAPKPAVRRAVTNENDENVAVTRVTRAKAAALESDVNVKKALGRTKVTAATTTLSRSRAALGDLSNVGKADGGSKDAKRKPLSTKNTLLSKAGHPTKVEKSSKTATKSVLTSKKAAIHTDLKKRPASGSGGSGHITKKRQTSASSTKVVLQDDAYDAENVEPVDDVQMEEEAKKAVKVEDQYDQDMETRSDTLDVPEDDEPVPDLDLEDLDDPLMVAEYVNDIFEYLRVLETQTMANPDYIDNQPDLEWQMRGILVDWLMEVHGRFRLLPETLFLAINIIDRFLSNKVVQLDRLQLVGVTAMFIASKYEEVLSPHVSNFRLVADDGFTDDEILSAERYVLTALNYDLSYPNPMNFLRRISKADNYDVHTRTIGKYLLEISCIDHHFIGHPPHRIAAAAMYMARLVLGTQGKVWDNTMAHYAGCKKEELEPCFQLMLKYLSGPVKHDAFFKKYAHKKFMKASMLVRQWVKQHGSDYMTSVDEKESQAPRKS